MSTVNRWQQHKDSLPEHTLQNLIVGSTALWEMSYSIPLYFFPALPLFQLLPPPKRSSKSLMAKHSASLFQEGYSNRKRWINGLRIIALVSCCLPLPFLHLPRSATSILFPLEEGMDMVSVCDAIYTKGNMSIRLKLKSPPSILWRLQCSLHRIKCWTEQITQSLRRHHQ